MKSSLIDLLDDGQIIIYDGALGTQIQGSVKAQTYIKDCNGCNELLNSIGPDAIVDIHTEYLRAGAHAIETNTFGANRPKLHEYALENRVYEINKAGASVARQAIDNFKSNRPLFVAGSFGPTGFLPSSQDPNLSKTGFTELVSIYQEQAEGLLDGGIDIALIETGQDLLEIRAAITGIRQAFKTTGRAVPLQVQITVDAQGRMLLGSNIDAFLGAVNNLGVEIVGLNCGMGPAEMKPYIDQLLQKSTSFVSMLANAGMPQNVNGKAFYSMDPKSFADHVESMVFGKGLQVVGGCCGTTPEHIAAVASRCGTRKTTVSIRKKTACILGTGIGGKDLESEARPIIIGERLNTQGSKKTRELVLAKNFDELSQMALEQIAKGSALLDICVAVNEQDTESTTMTEIISYLRDRVDVPFCVDTTEPEVMSEALKASPGSVMLNSINLEHGAQKARNVLALAKAHGCPVVALTIDDNGMAKTLEQKLTLARTIRNLACDEFGLPEHFVYIDPLVFTLATGEKDTADAALTSLESLRAIKNEMPGIRTVMGVSNVSYGLSPEARRVLNNVMLHHAVKAGLDAAIFNPLHIDDISIYENSVLSAAEDLLFNRKSDALSAYVDIFEQRKNHKSEKKPAVAVETMTPEEQVRNAIVKRNRKNLKETIDVLLLTHSAPDILNTMLLPAMGEVGEKMSRGEIILPFVLQSAEIMKEAVTVLEPHLKGSGNVAKGKIILATVYGDVHDIGKNLVGSILKNQGFTVIDLGKQVSVEKIIEAVQQEKPDAVGLSALLVTTSKQMALCVDALSREKLNTPVLIGGAAVNREYASRIAVLENGQSYSGGVYFAKDAFEASRLLDGFIDGSTTQNIVISSEKEIDKSEIVNAELIESCEHVEPPFLGTSSVLTWSAQSMIQSINKTRLFKGQWTGGRLDINEFENTVSTEFEPMFQELSKEIIDEDLLDAKGLYAFFPVITDDDKMILLDPSNYHTELATFTFPRMPEMGGRSLCDYFFAEGDTVAFQVVTIGKKIGEKSRSYFEKDEKYSRGFYLNAFANHCTEQLADKLTTEIRRCIGLEREQGRRYSFGFPGMPALEHQKRLFELLSVEERLDINLTDAFQMVPEHSTVGLFVHHPKAEYLK